MRQISGQLYRVTGNRIDDGYPRTNRLRLASYHCHSPGLSRRIGLETLLAATGWCTIVLSIFPVFERTPCHAWTGLVLAGVPTGSCNSRPGAKISSGLGTGIARFLHQRLAGLCGSDTIGIGEEHVI